MPVSCLLENGIQAANFFSQEKKIHGLQDDMKCPQQYMVIFE